MDERIMEYWNNGIEEPEFALASPAFAEATAGRGR